MSTIRLGRHQYGYTISRVDGDGFDDLLVQTDYDYPGVASSFGWSVVNVEEPKPHAFSTPCEHGATDGTIECACGTPASTFIASARDWLDDHLGDTADDPGYFEPETERTRPMAYATDPAYYADVVKLCARDGCGHERAMHYATGARFAPPYGRQPDRPPCNVGDPADSTHCICYAYTDPRD